VAGQTTFSEGGIRNVLNAARKQLPNDKPGIIFIKTPAHWLSDDNFRNNILQIAERFLGGVRRIVSVKFYVEPIAFSNNTMRIDLGYKEVSNARTDFGNNVDWNCFRKLNLASDANGLPAHYKRIILRRFRIGKSDGESGDE
jgi:hypothetical protein